MTTLNKDLVERLANGEVEAHAELKGVNPITLMLYGMAVKDIQEGKGQEQHTSPVDMDKVSQSLQQFNKR